MTLCPDRRRLPEKGSDRVRFARLRFGARADLFSSSIASMASSVLVHFSNFYCTFPHDDRLSIKFNLCLSLVRGTEKISSLVLKMLLLRRQGQPLMASVLYQIHALCLYVSPGILVVVYDDIFALRSSDDRCRFSNRSRFCMLPRTIPRWYPKKQF